MKNISKNNLNMTRKTVINLILSILLLICLIVFPFLLVETNILTSIIEVAEKYEITKPRYTEEEIGRTTYVDISGREYYISFEQNLPEETLLSYEDIISHKAQVRDRSGLTNTTNKDLYIAEMKRIPNLNYELRYRTLFTWINDMDNDTLVNATNDSTITQIESSRLARI